MVRQLSDDEVNAARQEVRDWMKTRPDVTSAHIAQFTTLSDSTVRAWIAGRFPGGHEVVKGILSAVRKAKAGDILAPGGREAVVLTEYAGKAVRRTKNTGNFYETQTARRIFEVLDYCSQNCAIGCVTADFGVGKTEAVREWQRRRAGKVESAVLEFTEFSSCDKVEFVRELCRQFGLPAILGSQSGGRMFLSLCDHLRDHPCLLVFDQCETVRPRVCQVKSTDDLLLSEGQASTPALPGDIPQQSNTNRDGLCSICRLRQANADGLCGACRIGRYAKAQRKYPEPSVALLEDLRAAFVGNTRQVSANLKKISYKFRWPVSHLKYEARKRGWRTQAERQAWTEKDEAYLREKIGLVSIGTIARKLKRSITAVTARADRLRLSRRVSGGYNISALCDVFGTYPGQVKGWINRGLLGKAHGHGGHGGEIWFAEDNVIRFIRNHADAYSLIRVDPVWFKAMLFGARSTG